MAEQHTAFTRMVDGLVESSGSDPGLLQEIQQLDLEARQRGISFYDAVFEVLYRHDEHGAKL